MKIFQQENIIPSNDKTDVLTNGCLRGRNEYSLGCRVRDNTQAVQC